jgi:hypothetical protein
MMKNSAQILGLAIGAFATLFISGCVATADKDQQQPGEQWQSLFDGQTLNGWTTKIVGYPAGQDPLETFRAKDGVLYINYDKYGGNMQSRWSHLFYKEPFKAYRLALEYRFVGAETPNTPPRRTLVNSGVLYHSQSPQSMKLNQLFPISAENQLLGPSPGLYHDGKPRATGSACGMGTLLSSEGKPPKECFTSEMPTRPMEQWVRLEIEVRPDGHTTHSIDGKPVASYDRLLLDTSDPRFPSQEMIDAAGGNTIVNSGYIALQSEGHQIEFRNIRILQLK